MKTLNARKPKPKDCRLILK